MARRLVYYVATTIDGYIARKDGSFDCLLSQGEHIADLIDQFPETFPTHLRSIMGIAGKAKQFDTVLMGRSTYEVGTRAGFTNPYAHLRQIVVSRSMAASPNPAVELCQEDPLNLVRKLKCETGENIWLCGGSILAASLVPEIDEMILKISPFALGCGIPLFAGDGEVGLRFALARHKAYSNGFVFAHYRATD